MAGAIGDISPPGFNQALIHGLRPLWGNDMEKMMILVMVFSFLPMAAKRYLKWPVLTAWLCGAMFSAGLMGLITL